MKHILTCQRLQLLLGLTLAYILAFTIWQYMLACEGWLVICIQVLTLDQEPYLAQVPIKLTRLICMSYKEVRVGPNTK